MLSTFKASDSFSKFSKKKSTSSLIVSATIIAFLGANSAFAQDKKQLKTQLSEITVKEKTQNETIGYKPQISRSSTRTKTALIDTPQSVSVVSQDQIQDQNITGMSEALRYVPGIVVHQGESNRDQISIRGNNTTADFFVDGARDDVQYFRDVYNMDRVEVLKGPNAMAFGRGGSGGVVNRVSKIANGEQINQITLTGGSFNNRRIAGDVGDKINDKVSFRINGMYEKTGTFRKYGNLERHGVSPTLGFDLTDQTNLQVGYEHFEDKRFNDRGIPSLNGLALQTKPSTFFGNPDQNLSEAVIDSVYADLNHEFSESASIRNYSRFTKNVKFYQNVFASGAVNSSTGNINIQAYNDSTDRDNFTNQTDFTKKFDTGSVKHTALIGMEISRQDTASFRNTGFFNNVATTSTVSVSNPISFTPITYRQNTNDANNERTVEVYAGYVQDQIEINKNLQLIAGLRHDRFKLKLHDNRTNNDFYQNDEMISPRAGLVLKPSDNLSFYTSYSVSYLPGSGDQFATLSANMQGLRPEQLTNYEIGSKWDVNPKLNLSAALYQLDRTNTRATDPNDASQFVLTGESQTLGAELTATGKVTNKWQVIAGYAFQDAEIKSTTTAATAGRKVALIPKTMTSLWNKYDLTSNFALGLGIINQSSQFAGADNTVRIKGFTRFDGAAYYKINSDYKLQLNVENILNKEYIATAHNNNNLQPGSPVNFRVSLVANF